MAPQTSDRRALALFSRKLVLWSLPIVLAFAFPMFVLYLGREFVTLQDAVREQQSQPHSLFGLAYVYADRSYKAELVDIRDAPVVALGSSRVMQFRKEMFLSPGMFSNAGGAVPQLDEARRFVLALPHKATPQVIILGLDQNFFKPSWNPTLGPEQATPRQRLLSLLSGEWRKVYTDYLAGKFDISQLFNARESSMSVGVDALINQNGFRSDGSRQYGSVIADPHRKATLSNAISAMRAQIASGRDTFAYGTTTSPASLEVLSNFLALCKERGIVVIGFLPPYAPSLYDEIGSVDDAYGLERDKLGGDVQTIFDQYNFSFFDFSHAATHGIAESEFIDPTHGSDKAYARILLDMAMYDSVLTRYVSISRLRDMIAASPSDFLNVQSDE